MKLRVVAFGTVLLALVLGAGCGGGLSKGGNYAARCNDGQLDFATSCGALCFGRDGVDRYLGDCR